MEAVVVPLQLLTPPLIWQGRGITKKTSVSVVGCPIGIPTRPPPEYKAEAFEPTCSVARVKETRSTYKFLMRSFLGRATRSDGYKVSREAVWCEA
jgi:hypothetical protein